ncbi:MAG TPA: DEAD/DEAH box helicase family protein [Oligoflexia bacterium]|nr:DEAD/DEAH box helicase family protein [Oligoflexia bacterium]HMP48039.1 DEAD/DEAH box helicase family protein [Oligoflexia bacterium]
MTHKYQSMDEFLAKNGISKIRTESLSWRPKQGLLLDSVLNRKGHLLISSPTGSGKTLLFFIRASIELQKMKRIVFCVTQVGLARQAKEHALQYLNISSEDISVLDGSISPDNRTNEYNKMRPVIIVVIQDLINDINAGRFKDDNISLFGLDEIHHAVGNHPYVHLIKWLKLHEKSITRIGVSATPARNRLKLNELIELFCPDCFLCLESDKASTSDLLKDVSLAPGVEPALRALKQVVKLKLERVYSLLPAPRLLFDDSTFPGWRPDSKFTKIPGHREIELLRSRISKSGISESDIGLSNMWLAEIGLLGWYYYLLSRVSPTLFLESFLYLRIKAELLPLIFLSNMERRKKVLSYKARNINGVIEKRENITSFERNVSRNKTLRAIFKSLSIGTTYAKFCSDKLAWNDLLGCDLATRLFESKMDKTGRKFKHNLQNSVQEVLDRLLIKSMTASSRLEMKAFSLLEIIQKYPEERMVVFCGTRRQAKAIYHYLREPLNRIGIAVEVAYSVSRKSEQEMMLKGLRNFDTGKSSILITTDYGREGKDIRASIGIETAVSSDPAKRVQSRGRVGRTGKNISDEEPLNIMYYLLHPGERQIIQIARGRVKHMRASFRRQSELVFEDEESPPPGFLF